MGCLQVFAGVLQSLSEGGHIQTGVLDHVVDEPPLLRRVVFRNLSRLGCTVFDRIGQLVLGERLSDGVDGVFGGAKATLLLLLCLGPFELLVDFFGQRLFLGLFRLKVLVQLAIILLSVLLLLFELLVDEVVHFLLVGFGGLARSVFLGLDGINLLFLCPLLGFHGLLLSLLLSLSLLTFLEGLHLLLGLDHLFSQRHIVFYNFGRLLRLILFLCLLFFFGRLFLTIRIESLLSNHVEC